MELENVFTDEGDADTEHEEIRDLIDRGVIRLCTTENGNVGVWLWSQEMADDEPYEFGDTAQEALLAAARKFKRGGSDA